MSLPTARPVTFRPAVSPLPANSVAHAVDVALAECSKLDGALLPVLHAVQEALGCVPNAAIDPVARALNLSRAEVHGVIGYYHHFRREPAGRRTVQVCRAESCRALGGEVLLAQARAATGCSETASTSADGAWTVEPVYCLGLCAVSPAAMVDGRLHGRLTTAALAALLGGAKAART